VGLTKTKIFKIDRILGLSWQPISR